MHRVRLTGVLGSLCLALFLGACAGVISGIPPKLDPIKRIGIVSAIGDKFYVQKMGMTVFGNDLNEFPASGWGIDDLMVGKVRAALGRRFDIRPVAYQRPPFYESNREGIGARVRAAVSPAAVDAYVVITRGGSPIGSSNQSVVGLGILEISGGVLFAKRHYVHAHYAVYVIDANTFSSMGVTRALMPGESQINPLRTTVLRGPHREVDQSWWPPSLDAASNPRLKGAVVELIDKSLANTLQQLELAN